MNNEQHSMPAYNSNQEALLMPEYGRMVQSMVQAAMEIPDKSARQQCARYIVSIMARMQDVKSERPDFEHKLWNHLARISHYQLDIDYPVDIVPEQEALAHPAPMAYPMKSIRRRHYGYLTEQMMNYLSECADEEERTELLDLTANHMRQNLFTWNPDSMDGDVVRQDLKVYTRGKVKLPQDFSFSPIVQDETQQLMGKKRKKKKNNGWRPS